MKVGKKFGYALITLSVIGYGIYRYNDSEAVKMAAQGDCGCSKKVVKSAPPADSQVIQRGGCSSCGPKVAVYNPLLIHPMFDPNEYQTQDLNDMGEPVNPYSYNPYSQTRRSFLVSNLRGGI